MDNAAAIYYKTKTKLNINSSLLFINLLNNLHLKSTSKQDSSKCSSHREIILCKSVRFILFLYILAIFPFLGKLKKVKLGFLYLVLGQIAKYCLITGHSVDFFIHILERGLCLDILVAGYKEFHSPFELA